MGKVDTVLTLAILGGVGVGGYLLFKNLPNIQQAISDFFSGIGKGATSAGQTVYQSSDEVYQTDSKIIETLLERLGQQGTSVTNNYITNTMDLPSGTQIIPKALSNPGWVSNAPAEIAVTRQVFTANPPTPQQFIAVCLGLPTSFINPAVNTSGAGGSIPLLKPSSSPATSSSSLAWWQPGSAYKLASVATPSSVFMSGNGFNFKH